VNEVTNRPGTDQVEVTVCICTFKRPSVLHALASVAAQEMPKGVLLGILVIDNDDAPTARDSVLDFRARSGVPIDYCHAPGQNISIARNAALDTVTTPWLAFLDDDEQASSRWIAGLLAERQGANSVFGPCEAIYPANSPSWIKAGAYHSNRIPQDWIPIDTGYTSNVLVDMKFVRQHGLRFDISLGRTGGEDTLFFHAMYRKGGVLRYASEAVVFEHVAPSRINLGWIVRRRYRAGQVYALMFHQFDRSGYRRKAWTASLKIVACAAMSLVKAFNPERAIWWLMRGTFHCGVLSYAFGMRVHEEYGVKKRPLDLA
jgi:succinoglycan biosynthesis protein ExoM